MDIQEKIQGTQETIIKQYSIIKFQKVFSCLYLVSCLPAEASAQAGILIIVYPLYLAN
ncbi:MAG: hypothetical protein WC288_01705 [Candidatus Paceibacterota bacterium]|jgi:hypothetical protein